MMKMIGMKMMNNKEIRRANCSPDFFQKGLKRTLHISAKSSNFVVELQAEPEKL